MLLNSQSDVLHEVVVKVQIVKNAQTHSKHLLRLEKMSYICLTIIPACRTAAALLDRLIVKLILRIEKINLSPVGIYMPMSSVP